VTVGHGVPPGLFYELKNKELIASSGNTKVPLVALFLFLSLSLSSLSLSPSPSTYPPCISDPALSMTSSSLSSSPAGAREAAEENGERDEEEKEECRQGLKHSISSLRHCVLEP